MIRKAFGSILFLAGLSPVALSVEWRDPLPAFEPGSWNWIDIPGTYCRDGSGAGLSVSYGESDKLMILLEGGGACFNNQTCNLNPSSANKQAPDRKGVFDRDNPDNPFADWNVVFIPYCTGDVFTGDRENVDVSRSITGQQFVGFRNMTIMLEHIAPTFSNASQVLLTGYSAGGFGALFNYDQTREIFGPSTDVYMVDDSGIPFTDNYLATCLQNRWRTLWGMQFPSECVDCQQDNGGGFTNYFGYLTDKYPDNKMGFISSTGDTTIRLFYGFGRNNCNVIIPSTPSSQYRRGLLEVRDEVVGEDGVFFYFSGSTHTYLQKDLFYTQTSEGVQLSQWMTNYLDGTAVNRGP